jgi:hypothetical protein
MKAPGVDPGPSSFSGRSLVATPANVNGGIEGSPGGRVHNVHATRFSIATWTKCTL